MQLLDKEQSYIKALIYGDPGTGKTNFGVSAPSPLILLSERQALVSVRDAANRLGVPVPPALFMASLEDYAEVLFALKSSKPGETLTVKSNGKVILSMPYPESVVLDSLTDIGELARADVNRVSPPQTGKDGLPAWSMRHWGSLGDKITNLVLHFRNIPAHVIFLALKDDKEIGEADEKSRSVGPSMPMRKLGYAVAAAVNVIGVTHRRTIPGKEKDEASLEYSVMTVGPDYALTKPYRPLLDREVSDFSSWVTRIRAAAQAGQQPQPEEEKKQA